MESSPLDFVAQACMELTDTLNACAESEKESIILNHIKNVWCSMTPVDDFKRNLEWVNVSEPVSLAYHCLDKVVVLDFWTYCCINCYHVLPDLAHLEKLHKVEDGLVVIGVHCAKFTNEQETSNVLAAVQRYEITHPVVNDPESTFWKTLGIHCWPTLVILGPGSKPLFVLIGEGHREELVQYVGAALKYFGSRLSTAPLPVALNKHIKSKTDSILKFPGKVALNPFYRGRTDEPYLAISDTGNHRVILTDCTGVILRIIGGPEPGYKDGKLSTAQLRSPQGVCWLSGSVLAVCDAGNHALRAAHLDDGYVEGLGGTGAQADKGDQGGKCLGLQALSSPWDVILFTTPDMDMSVRPPPPPPPPTADQSHANTTTSTTNSTSSTTTTTTNSTTDDDVVAVDSEKNDDKKDPNRRVLLIACAGSHQLWALFLDTTIWWKYKTYSEGTCVCVAGSGAEAARNSAYPNTAAFAQPSGLTLRPGNNPEVFIADSESSSIRKLALSTGQVTTLCGGDRNPMNLFAFGDVDEVGHLAKLQHPMGVAYCEVNKTLFVADSYNNKIKRVDLSTQKVTTLNPTMIETADPVGLREPAGLSVTADGKYLFIADTNNHSVKILNLAKNVCQELRVRPQETRFTEPENLILYKNDLFVNRKCGSLIIYFNVSLDENASTKNVSFTEGAAQAWQVSVRDQADRDVTAADFEFVRSAARGVRLPGRVELRLRRRPSATHYRLYLAFRTALCDHDVCFSHSFTVRSTMLVRDSVKMVESYKITCKINPVNRISDAKAVDSKPTESNPADSKPADKTEKAPVDAAPKTPNTEKVDDDTPVNKEDDSDSNKSTDKLLDNTSTSK